jgi:hypothetical protein
MTMNTLSTLAICVAAPCVAMAQDYRPDQVPVVVTAAPGKPVPEPDPVAQFSRGYASAGRPKVALLWNRTVSDRTHNPSAEKTTTQESGKSSKSASGKSTQGADGTDTLQDEDSTFDRKTVVTKATVMSEEQQRAHAVDEAVAAVLQNAFLGEMNRAGVAFVDRALAMRTTTAKHHRGGGDRQIIEMDALLDKADWIIEVVWLKDSKAPSGYGFDLRIKDLRSGQHLGALYTRAAPRAEPKQGRWVPGANGYEWHVPAAEPPSVARVGTTLAHETMGLLARAFLIANTHDTAPRR